MLSTLVLSNENQTCRRGEAPASTGGGGCHKLLEYAGGSGDVADPWYTGDFEKAYQDIYHGYTAALDKIQEEYFS